jgi:serine/threonine protein kinase
MATPELDEAAIFNAARLIATPEERRLYVQHTCAEDPALQARIEAMLRLHDQEPSFLEPPPEEPGIPVEVPPAAELGAQIGPYKLIRKIGEGGMGTVFMAEQSEPVKRTVAVKIIRPGMDSRRIIARFEAERQALALMDHPNIAKVLDAGGTPPASHPYKGGDSAFPPYEGKDSASPPYEGGDLGGCGRPYFVMELVDGVPITKYCDQQRLTPRERLELFIPVCQAVQHAHQKGIIHRDLKPTNVLVARYDEKAVPKIIDFGVAKAVDTELADRAELTEFGSVIGTLEYMSPEQAEPGQPDIDTRSDIYALGALLYELLTGTTPLQPKRLRGAALLELLRIVREEEPPAPSSRLSTTEELPSIAANRHLEPKKLSGLMRGDLDWIVMKCLEKNRTRRYETANGLARDIERYLNDEVVEACPPSAGYRIRKFARKHKKALVTVGAFALLLVTATVVSLGLASWALQERKQAEGQKQLAESNLKKALEAVDQMLTRVAEAQLLNVPQMEPVRRDLLQDALRFYQEFLRERNDSPLVRSEAASAYKRMGSILVLLGNRDEGEKAYQQALVLLEQLLAEVPGDPVLGNKLAGVHIDLGRLYHTSQRWPQAEASLQRAVSILDEHPSLFINQVDLAKSHLSLVGLYRQMGNLDQGEQEFRKKERTQSGNKSRMPMWL